jgi:hypothetical protein
MDRYVPSTNRPTATTPPNDHKILPKHFSPPLTCFFWSQNGRCNKRDVDCAYAHYLTGHLAAAPINIPGRTCEAACVGGVEADADVVDPYAAIAVAGKNVRDVSALAAGAPCRDVSGSAVQVSEWKETLREREVEVARREREVEERENRFMREVWKREDVVRSREDLVRKREERVGRRERAVKDERRRRGRGREKMV